MSLFAALDARDTALLDTYLEERAFRAGDRLVRQGDAPDGCFILREGTVRLEIAVDSLDGDGVLGFLDAGDVLGELSFFDDVPRSATAVAETAVTTRWLSLEAYRRLAADAPELGIRLLTAIGQQLSARLRTMNQRVAAQIAIDNHPAFLDECVARAQQAGERLHGWSDTRIEGLIASVCRAVADAAEPLAEHSARSVGIGVAADQIALIRLLAARLPDQLADRPAAGTVERDGAGRIVASAYPVGVVAGLVPANGPVATLMYLASVCLRARAPLICAAHRRATGVAREVAGIVRAALADNGAPSDLVQCLDERPSRRTTLQLVGHPGVGFAIAAAGSDMARAAMASGKPTVAQGSGDAPVLVCGDADLAAAAEAVVRSRSFDAGLLAGAEGTVHVVRSAWEGWVAALERAGAAVLSAAESEWFVAAHGRPDGLGFRGGAIGQPAADLAAACGVERPYPIRVIAMAVPRGGGPALLQHDRPFPCIVIAPCDDESDGTSLIARGLAERRGAVAAGIHGGSEHAIERFVAACEAPRIVVNEGTAVAAHGIAGGGPVTMLLPAGTAQGCPWSQFGGANELRNVRVVLR